MVRRQLEWLMRRYQRASAALEMTGKQALQQRDSRSVERGRRLVEEPQRAAGQRQAREAQAPTLPLGERTRRKPGLAFQRDAGERIAKLGSAMDSPVSATSAARFSSAVSSSFSAGK